MLRINRLNARLLILQIRNNYFLKGVFFDLGELPLSLLKNPPFLLQLINLLWMIYRALLELSFNALFT